MRRLIGRYGFTATDRDDLEQNLILFLMQKIAQQKQRADNQGPWLRTLIQNHLASIVRHQKRKKRCRRRVLSLDVLSLDVLVPDEDGDLVRWSRLISEEHARARIGTGHREGQEVQEPAPDVERVLESLAGDLRDVCRCLQLDSKAGMGAHDSLPSVDPPICPRANGSICRTPTKRP